MCVIAYILNVENKINPNTLSFLTKGSLQIWKGLELNSRPNFKRRVGQFSRKLITSRRYFLQCGYFVSGPKECLNLTKTPKNID